MRPTDRKRVTLRKVPVVNLLIFPLLFLDPSLHNLENLETERWTAGAPKHVSRSKSGAYGWGHGWRYDTCFRIGQVCPGNISLICSVRRNFSDYEKQNKLDGKYSPQFSCMWRLSYAGGMFKLQSLKLTPTIIQPISFNLLSTCGSYVLQTPSISLKGPWTRSNEGQLFERSDPSWHRSTLWLTMLCLWASQRRLNSTQRTIQQIFLLVFSVSYM